MSAPIKWRVDHNFSYGWDDAGWTEDLPDGTTVPLRFDTREAAKAEINDHVQTCAEEGLDGYAREDFIAVPDVS